MSLVWPPKDPEEVLDYVIDWTDRLGTDTISTSTFTLTNAEGLVIDSQTNSTTTSTIWLSAGTLGETAEILCQITTAAGRTMEQSVKIKLRAR